MSLQFPAPSYAPAPLPLSQTQIQPTAWPVAQVSPGETPYTGAGYGDGYENRYNPGVYPRQPAGPAQSEVNAPNLSPAPSRQITRSNAPISSQRLNALERRWFAKGIFKKDAPPEEQIANPWKFAAFVGLSSLAVRFLRIFVSVPLAVVAYLWQDQRNKDAIAKLRQ